MPPAWRPPRCKPAPGTDRAATGRAERGGQGSTRGTLTQVQRRERVRGLAAAGAGPDTDWHEVDLRRYRRGSAAGRVRVRQVMQWGQLVWINADGPGVVRPLLGVALHQRALTARQRASGRPDRLAGAAADGRRRLPPPGRHEAATAGAVVAASGLRGQVVAPLDMRLADVAVPVRVEMGPTLAVELEPDPSEAALR